MCVYSDSADPAANSSETSCSDVCHYDKDAAATDAVANDNRAVCILLNDDDDDDEFLVLDDDDEL